MMLKAGEGEFPFTVVWPTPVSLLVSQQPAHHWKKGSSAVKLKQSSARCARCATTPRSCPRRRTWITWTRSWKPSGCRDNQRQAITSSRSGGGVLGSNPFLSTKTPETKCPFWKNALTFPAKEVRDRHSTLWYWSKQPLKTQSWPPSKLSYTWLERRHLHHLLSLLPPLHPHFLHLGCPELGKGKANPLWRKRRMWKWSGTGKAEGVKVKAFLKASEPHSLLSAGGGAHQDWRTGGTLSSSPLWQHQTHSSLWWPEPIIESCASCSSHVRFHRFGPRTPRKEGERAWERCRVTGAGGVCVKIGDNIYFVEFPKLISISALLFSYHAPRWEVILAESWMLSLGLHAQLQFCLAGQVKLKVTITE